MTVLSTNNSALVSNDNTSVSVGSKGPLIFSNFTLFEKLAHFNRERVPERVVHARGTGAYGTFVLKKDLSSHTIARFLCEAGRQTEVFVRFSTVDGGRGSSDYTRDPRGFAVKFYTEQGNWDMVGNNTTVFFLRDPQKFPDFIHSQKKHPQSNLPFASAMYEFWVNNPQSLHQLTILMFDRGIPQSYRHMNDYSSHTLSFWNKEGERFWVKWHFKTKQGIKCFTNQEAEQQPSHGAQADLFLAIQRGQYPQWDVKIQLMSEERALNQTINHFDLAKIWYHSDFPLIDIGVLELNHNVENYFAEVEQAAFSPSNLVPGIGASPDKMLQARLLAYQDAHHYRLGTNCHHLLVNKPRCPMNNYQRDGFIADIQYSQGNSVNFYPNDQKDSPQPDKLLVQEPPLKVDANTLIDYYDAQGNDNYSQAGKLYRLMSDKQRSQLVNNISDGLSQASKSIRKRMVEQFTLADADYGKMVNEKLNYLSKQSGTEKDKHFVGGLSNMINKQTWVR